MHWRKLLSARGGRRERANEGRRLFRLHTQQVAPVQWRKLLSAKGGRERAKDGRQYVSSAERMLGSSPEQPWSSPGPAQECLQKWVGLLSEMAVLVGKLLKVDPPILIKR